MLVDDRQAEGSPSTGTSRPTLLLTSFLVGALKHVGPLVAPKTSATFLESAGRHREVFLPFFYRWFDHRQWAQDQALRLIKASLARERIEVPRVFHAPFTGRYGLPVRGYHRDLAEERRANDHGRALQRECAFLGRLRREFGIRERMLYVLHLGRRHGRSAAEALKVAVSAVRPAVDSAREAGVVLALENVADRSGDQHPVGARLTEVEDALGELGDGTDAASPLGWTFDISHALLGYRGDTEAIFADLRRMLPSLVHLHVNAPRFYPSEEPWADRHEAPTEGFRPLWDLFNLACSSPRFQEFQTVTYEVNWASPFLNPVIGGSPLNAVVQGYQLVEAAAEKALASLGSAQSVLSHPAAESSLLPEEGALHREGTPSALVPHL